MSSQNNFSQSGVDPTIGTKVDPELGSQDQTRSQFDSRGPSAHQHNDLPVHHGHNASALSGQQGYNQGYENKSGLTGHDSNSSTLGGLSGQGSHLGGHNAGYEASRGNPNDFSHTNASHHLGKDGSGLAAAETGRDIVHSQSGTTGHGGHSHHGHHNTSNISNTSTVQPGQYTIDPNARLDSQRGTGIAGQQDVSNSAVGTHGHHHDHHHGHGSQSTAPGTYQQSGLAGASSTHGHHHGSEATAAGVGAAGVGAADAARQHATHGSSVANDRDHHHGHGSQTTTTGAYAQGGPAGATSTHGHHHGSELAAAGAGAGAVDASRQHATHNHHHDHHHDHHQGHGSQPATAGAYEHGTPAGTTSTHGHHHGSEAAAAGVGAAGVGAADAARQHATHGSSVTNDRDHHHGSQSGTLGSTANTAGQQGAGLGSSASTNESATATKNDASTDPTNKNSDYNAGPPPNIPTAGGERIGTKHWGESKVIPRDPLKGKSTSEEGQVDDLTKKNTASNTGSAGHDHDGDEGEKKESTLDKIKDKLHIGSK